MKSNIKLIQTIVDNGLERHYAVWLRLKSLHENSRIYDYSIKKISDQSGISRTGLRSHLDFFIQNKWVRIEGNDIIFIGTKQLKKLYNIRLRYDIKIDVKGSTGEIVDTLRYELFKHKQRQFEYAKQVNNDRNNPTGIGALKRYKKANKDVSVKSREVTANLQISVSKLANLINKSGSTVSNLIKKKGAEVIRGKKTIAKGVRNIDLPCGFYWASGFIIQVQCNQYNFFLTMSKL